MLRTRPSMFQDRAQNVLNFSWRIDSEEDASTFIVELSEAGSLKSKSKSPRFRFFLSSQFQSGTEQFIF